MSERTKQLPEPVLDGPCAQRLADAVGFAAQRHGRQARKGTRVPYVSHLFHVAALVLEYGGSLDQAIAALLHDVVEDADVSYAELSARFGQPVSDIVRSCTDTLEHDSALAKSPWIERKRHYLGHLQDASADALLVSACDKRHNLGSLVDDVRHHGVSYLEHFNSEPAAQVWFYRSFAACAAPRVPSRLATELRALAEELAGLVSSTAPIGGELSRS